MSDETARREKIARRVREAMRDSRGPTASRPNRHRRALLTLIFVSFSIMAWHSVSPRAFLPDAAAVRGAEESLDAWTSQGADKMKIGTMAMVAGAAMATMSGAGVSAQLIQFARSTDTVRLTQQVVVTDALTIEARVWVEPGAPMGNIWREQRNSLEDKFLSIGADAVLVHAAGTSRYTTSNVPTPTGQWIHVVGQIAGQQAKIWIDGVLVANEAYTATIFANSASSSNAIGADRHNVGSVTPGTLCRIDWLRVSTCARYSTDTFTPPHECDLLPADSCAALLFLFNDPVGSSTLQNFGVATGVADVGPAWFSGATAPVLSGASADADGNGIADVCKEDPCPTDLDNSGSVTSVDLAIILSSWGPPSAKYPQSDINGDGVVNAADLTLVLSSWGECP